MVFSETTTWTPATEDFSNEHPINCMMKDSSMGEEVDMSHQFQSFASIPVSPVEKEVGSTYPVHTLPSFDRMLEMEEAVVPIQAAFRGYAVRRCHPLGKLRKIAEVRTKLKKLTLRACDPIYIDKLCLDVMENRKMTEEIMALLLELDTIQGVLPVVRRIRKSVTRDVVQFQEIVDAVIVDARARHDVASESANVATENPRLRRVMSLDDNVYPEQSYVYQANNKISADGEGSSRSSDDDAVPRRRSESTQFVPPVRTRSKDVNGRSPLLARSASLSGNMKNLAGKSVLLGRTNSELPLRGNPSVRSPLLGRSISEVQRKTVKENPLLGRSISEVQRKKTEHNISSPVSVSLSSDVVKPVSPITAQCPIIDPKVSLSGGSPSALPKPIALDAVQAAIRIQSRYRGHLSRRSRPLKHLRTISDVNFKLRELNQQFSDESCLKRLRSDRMERLKWSEGITALLLQLDSVQGVDQAVRDIRKSVTREVIKLQEQVDGIIHEAEITPRKSCELIATPVSPEVDENVTASCLTAAQSSAVRYCAQLESQLWDDKFVDSRRAVEVRQCDGDDSGRPQETAGSQNAVNLHEGVGGTGTFHEQVALESAVDLPDLDVDSTASSPQKGVSSPNPVLIRGTEIEQEAQTVNDGVASEQVSTTAKLSFTSKTLETGSIVQPSSQTSAIMSNGIVASVPNAQCVELSLPSQTIAQVSTDVDMEHTTWSDNRPSRICTEEFSSYGRSPPRFVSCGHRHPEERASKYLRARADDCMDHESGKDRISQGELLSEDLLAAYDAGSYNAFPMWLSKGSTLDCKSPACKAQENIYANDLISDELGDPGKNLASKLHFENLKLRVLLDEVLQLAEQQARDLNLTKEKLADLESEVLHYRKRDETGSRKKATASRRRR